MEAITMGLFDGIKKAFNDAGKADGTKKNKNF